MSDILEPVSGLTVEKLRLAIAMLEEADGQVGISRFIYIGEDI